MFDARFLSKEESYHFFVCLVRDLFKWKHKLASNALTLGGRVSSRKLCILCSHVKREKKSYWMSFSALESTSNVTNIVTSDHL